MLANRIHAYVMLNLQIKFWRIWRIGTHFILTTKALALLINVFKVILFQLILIAVKQGDLGLPHDRIKLCFQRNESKWQTNSMLWKLSIQIPMAR